MRFHGSILDDSLVDNQSHLVQESTVPYLKLAINITDFNVIKGYNVKNNKLKTYPYSFLRISNNMGNINDYKFENFRNPNEILFSLWACACENVSCKLTPYAYKTNISDTEAEEFIANEDESITLGKYPIFSWSSDSFTNWLTQNGVNIATNVVGSLVGGAISIGAGAMTGNAIGVAGGIASISGSIANTIGGINQASMQANASKGNANSGDISFLKRLLKFTVEHIRPKNEYLQILDDYFTRFGYKINRTKAPNITGRQYWNYLEIGQSEIIGTGSVPSQYMEEINNACRKGVTIWHNHSNIGNYNLNNSIV